MRLMHAIALIAVTASSVSCQNASTITDIIGTLESSAPTLPPLTLPPFTLPSAPTLPPQLASALCPVVCEIPPNPLTGALGINCVCTTSTPTQAAQQQTTTQATHQAQQQTTTTQRPTQQQSSVTSGQTQSHNNGVCPNSGGYNSNGQPPSGGYSCQTSTHCSGSAQCSCNGACYDPSQYCCYEGHLGQAVDTVCSCPGYTEGGCYAPTPAYNGQNIYFPSCDCTQVALECPYAQTTSTPSPTYWSPACSCMVNIYGQPMSNNTKLSVSTSSPSYTTPSTGSSTSTSTKASSAVNSQTVQLLSAAGAIIVAAVL